MIKKTGEKEVTVSYKEVSFDLSGVKGHRDCHMSAKIYDSGYVEVFDGDDVEVIQRGSGDDDFCCDWKGWHDLILTLVGDMNPFEFVYDESWIEENEVTVANMLKTWFKENPQFATHEKTKEFMESDEFGEEGEEDGEDSWLFE
jgi:hypothetical protein